MRLNVGADYVFLIYGPHVWGKGKTLKEAMNNAKKNIGPDTRVELKKNHDVFLIPPSGYVDDFGNICWKKEEGKPDHCIRITSVRDNVEIAPENWDYEG